MADKSFEQMPDAVEALPDAAEREELSTPVTLIEESDTLTQVAGETENTINTVEYTEKNGRAKTVVRKREASTPEERANQKSADITPQQPKKAPARKRTTPVESAPPIIESAETPVVKKPATRQRKKAVESVVSATETEMVSEPKKPTTRRRTKPVEPTLPVTETMEMPAAAAEPSALLPERVPEPIRITDEIQEPAALIENEEAPVLPEELNTIVEEEVAASEEHNEIIASVEVIPAVETAAMVPTGIVEKTPVVLEETTRVTSTTERGHLVRSAALVSIGNLGSSLLGMVRQIVVTGLGNSVAGPFNAALTPVNNFYQLLVNGSTDGALIPVFNEYSASERRYEMRRVVFTVVNLILIIAAITSIGYLLIAPWFVNALVSGYAGADKALTLQFSQIIFFSMVVLGPFAVLLAALFSLKEFGWPAFATAAYHVGIILGALVATFIGVHTWGLIALPIGLLVGATGQIALLLPGIRKRKLYYLFVLDLKHPALKRIYRLYWPIAVSYVFSTALVFLDLHLQSWTPQREAATTAMVAATTLIQFPIGLVAQALSIAVLPTLAEHARANNTERFKETLLLGIRLGLLLMIPAMTGLLLLRTPIMYLIFAHHNYSLHDADLGALALQNYAYQLPFVVMDQLLIAAFYARRNTIIPVAIGIVSMLFYLVVALPFYSTIGVAALAFANTVQNSSHAIILLILLRILIGPLHIRKTLPSILKICASAVLMGLVAWGAMALLSHVALFSLDHLIGQFLTLIVAGGVASVVYFGAVMLFKVEEINLVKGVIRAKLGKR